MMGLPFRIIRHTDDEVGKVDKTFYLATRRSGDAGAAMKKAKRDYHRAELELARAQQRCAHVNRRLGELDADAKDYEQQMDASDVALEAITVHLEEMKSAAEKLARLSLTENYGKNAAADVMDQLTDSDLDAMVSVIETGEMPKDFFPVSGQEQKSTTTSPPGGSLSESSSSTATPKRRSNKKK